MNGSGISLSNSRSARDSRDPSYNEKANSSFEWTTAISSEGVFANKFIGNEIFGNIAIGIGTPKIPGDITTCPFYVDKNGKLHATGADISGTVNANSFKINGKEALTGGKISSDYLELKGLSIVNNRGQTTFSIDSNGHVTINGGSIEFTNSELDGLKNRVTGVESDLSDKMDKNPIESTKIGSNYVYTGTINANQIKAGKISAEYLDVSGAIESYLDGGFGQIKFVDGRYDAGGITSNANDLSVWGDRNLLLATGSDGSVIAQSDMEFQENVWISSSTRFYISNERYYTFESDGIHYHNSRGEFVTTMIPK